MTSSKGKPKTKAKRRPTAASRLRRVEDDVLEIKAKLSVIDGHYGKLLAPIVGVQASIKALEERGQYRDRKIDVLYRGVDKLLKGGIGSFPGGMAAVEAEG